MGLFNGGQMRNVPESKGVQKKKQHPVKIYFGVLKRKWSRFITIGAAYFIAALPMLAFLVLALVAVAGLHGYGDHAKVLYGDMMLFMLICIPLIALLSGPATMGITYVLRNYAREQHAWGLSDMLEKASKNYFQGMMIGLIDSVFLLFMVWMYYYYANMTGETRLHLINYVIVVLVGVFFMMRMYIYPMAVSYKLKLKDLYRYSMTLAFLKLPQNLLILGLTIAVFVVIGMLSVTALILVIALGGLALMLYTHIFYVDRVLLENMDEGNEKVYVEKDRKGKIEI